MGQAAQPDVTTSSDAEETKASRGGLPFCLLHLVLTGAAKSEPTISLRGRKQSIVETEFWNEQIR